jgi:uncharacterized repeat protein (TIGR03809 family)
MHPIPRTDIFMGQRPVVYFSDGFADRGLALAERRLAHFAELYDSGRWRRYYFREADFLLNVREARAAVDAWRRLRRDPPVEQEAIGATTMLRDTGATLAPPEPGVAVDEFASSLSDSRGDQDDRGIAAPRRSSLPQVMFSAHDVLAEGDLAEA